MQRLHIGCHTIIPHDVERCIIVADYFATGGKRSEVLQKRCALTDVLQERFRTAIHDNDCIASCVECNITGTCWFELVAYLRVLFHKCNRSTCLLWSINCQQMLIAYFIETLLNLRLICCTWSGNHWRYRIAHKSLIKAEAGCRTDWTRECVRDRVLAGAQK